MDYDAVAAHFLVPTGSIVAEPDLPDTPARSLRDAVEPIATIGWWSRPAAEAMLALGHGFFDGYVWGRAASLGADVAGPVVVSAFGVFQPDLLTATYQQGRAVSSRDAVLSARAAGAIRGLRGVAAAGEGALDDDVLEALGAPLLAALDGLDGTGRPLFGALRELPLPEDAAGRAWRAAELVREHRGDGHVAAVVASGLDVVEANVLTETWLGYRVGEYSSSRGFGPDRLAEAVAGLRSRGWLDAVDGLTDEGRTARLELERATDASQTQLIGRLGDAIDDLLVAAHRISGCVLAARAAPADPRKRAAG